MPEEVKLMTDEDDSQCDESSVCDPDLHQHQDQHQHQQEQHQHHHHFHERETSRSESSSCSDESATYRLNGHDTVEVIPTRTLKTSVPKPAANPLQFIKIGPCDLYRSAQQQLQKVGEVQKPAKKEVKDEIEDWQSNLDSWKCSRRKQQEHIIERVVEVKKLELEEHDRNRKRTKTFNEMMEERTSKGRKLSLPVYLDEDADDLSDLGISSSKCVTKSSSPIPEENDEKSGHDRSYRSSGDVSSRGPDSDAVVRHNGEATYEGAIHSYETRMKSLTNGGSGSGGDCGSRKKKAAACSPSAAVVVGGRSRFGGRRASATKIEQKLGELERVKNRSASSTDLTAESNKKALGIPKVNIFARREMFEKISDEQKWGPKTAAAASGEEVPRIPTIKERLSSLEKQVEETSNAVVVAAKSLSNVPTTEVSVRHRLCSIDENMRRQTENVAPPQKAAPALVPTPVAPTCVVAATSPRHLIEEPSVCTTAVRLSPRVDCQVETKVNGCESVATHRTTTKPAAEPVVRNAEPAAGRGREYSSSGRSSSSSEDYENVPPHLHHQHHHPHYHHHHGAGSHNFHHRSLDSLQGHDLADGFCFERVQSLECVDCGGVSGSNYPASVLSGDTDREDSGIHTADVSSSVSQADDFDLHADASIEADVVVVVVVPAAAAAKGDAPLTLSPVADSADGVGEIVAARTRVRASGRNDVEQPQDDTRERESPSNDTTMESDLRTRFADQRDYRATVVPDAFQPEKGRSRVPEQSSTRVCGRYVERADDIERSRVTNCVGGEPKAETGADGGDAENTLRAKNDERCVEGGDGVAKTPAQGQQLAANSPQSAADQTCVAANFARKESTNANVNVNDAVGRFEDESCFGNDIGVANEKILAADIVEEQGGEFSVLAEDVPDGLAPPHPAAVFAFEPSTAAVVPPREKPPPPPPLDNSDDESDLTDCSGLRRMDSTRRIKKQIRQKRSSFLGIEGFDDDSYLEPELESVKRPPDMTTFLQEERRLEKLLYRQSICSESDSTQGESRDSGVELDKNQMDEHSWITEDTHSRQDSETYANTSTTSEEDEIIRKEREILEILELEERRNYENDLKNDYSNLGEKLVLKLKELERRKNVCWKGEEENRIHGCNSIERLDYKDDYCTSPMQPQSQPQKQWQQQLPEERRPHSDPATLLSQKLRSGAGRSLQDVSRDSNSSGDGDGGIGGGSSGSGADARADYEEQRTGREYHRSSMPNIRQELTAATPSQYHRVPPPIPPNKPAALPREVAPAVADDKVSSPQQMSKQTLQALSAVPRSKIVATDSWVLSKRKPRQEAYNYQHWLIQEAEHRRITEYHRRFSNYDSGRNNYANVRHDYADGTTIPPNDPIPLDNRLTAPPNRSLYTHPQMLPHRNRDQDFAKEKNVAKSQYKPLPDAVIQTLTQRVQNRLNVNDAAHKPRRRENHLSTTVNQQEKMLSVSGKKKCSHCGEELGRGAAMIIESLRLFYHIDCFKCCVCCVQLGDGLMGTDVRVRNSKLHCHSCYSNDEGLKFSCV